MAVKIQPLPGFLLFPQLLRYWLDGASLIGPALLFS
jgi:hypothetical protein